MLNLAPDLQSLLERPAAKRTIGPFVLVEPLGSGGFAPVWLAKEVYGKTELRTAAVKLFGLGRRDDPAGALRRARIVDEARALCQVEHPNVVRFYSLSIDEASGVMGLAMEHVAGVSLDRRLAEEGHLPVAEALAVGTAVASALAAVHQAGLVHCDVKPANVIDAAGVYKLIDFGVASAGAPRAGEQEREEAERVRLDDLPREAASPGARTRTASTVTAGFVYGTFGYVDPVCIETGAPADAASDLYALGALLFECLTGSVPAAVGAREGVALRGDVLDGRTPAPPLLSVAPDVPPALAAVVDALLSLKREERPVSAEQVAIELDRIRSELRGRRRALPPESVGPFRGLGRFEEADRDVYFGRGSEVAAALEMLRGRGLVALVGPSGSGKSSLARAGVLPAVAEGALGGWPREWDCAIAEPGHDPRAALTAALAPFVPDAATLDPAALVAALGDRVRATERGVVLLVDQLEELATRSARPGQELAAALLGLLGERALPGVRVIVTARRDLLDPVLAMESLGRVLSRGLVLIEPMTALAWEAVLDQALAAYGYALEDDALREELAAEIKAAAGAMPLLQFALTELWDKRDTAQKKVTRAGLSSIGGLAGALERHAERTLAALEDPRAQAAARAVLLALTTPEGTRAQVRRDELARRAGPGGEDAIVALERARLVLPGEEGVTLAHEALITQWGRLRAWVAEARNDRLLADELERDATRWRESTDLVALWQKHRLASGEGLRGRELVHLSERAEAFLTASRGAARRARVRAVSLLAVVLVAVTAGVVSYVRAIREQRDAIREQRDAARTASMMASARELLARKQPGVAAMVVAAMKDPGKVRGWGELATDILAQPNPMARLAHRGHVTSALWSPDGKRVLTTASRREKGFSAYDSARWWSLGWGEADSVAQVWGTDGTGDPLVLDGGAVLSAAWSPDGSRIAGIVISEHDDFERLRELQPDGAAPEVYDDTSWVSARVWNTEGAGASVVLEGAASFVVWSPDGKRIVTGSRDGPGGEEDRGTDQSAIRGHVARVWNADGSGPPIVLEGHLGTVWSAAWSPDGTRIVTGSADMTARIWSADGTGAPVVLVGHGGRVKQVAWSPDGKHIVTVAEERFIGGQGHTSSSVRVWNADGTGNPLVLGDPEGFAFAVWSPDGKRIVTKTQLKNATVWNADGTGDLVVLKGDTSWINSAAWSSDGKRIVTTSDDGTARVWNADGTGAPTTLVGHEVSATSAAWSSDGKRIVTASDDGTARVWNVGGTSASVVLEGHRDWVSYGAWSPDGKHVVTASFDGTARVWNADGTGAPIVLDGHDIADPMFAAWSPDGRRIVTATYNGPVLVWNADGTGTPSVLGRSNVESAAWSPDGRRIVTVSDDVTRSRDDKGIVTASLDETARIWNADGVGTPIVLESHETLGRVMPGFKHPRMFAAWSPDGKRILIVSSGGAVRVWNADGTGSPIVLNGHVQLIPSAKWSPDSKRIVSGANGLESDDFTATIWNADGTGTPISLVGHEGGLQSAAWSPDGKRILTASSDMTARVWDLDGKGTSVVIKDQGGWLLSAAWSPDGKQIVTTTESHTAVWNADGTGPLIVLKAQGITFATWSPDGERILTTSNDGTARIWLATTPALQRALCDATTDCLTPEQRQTYLAESDSEARDAYEACERSHDRTPFYADAPKP